MSKYVDADKLTDIITNHAYELTSKHNSTGVGMFTDGILQAIDEAKAETEAEGIIVEESPFANLRTPCGRGQMTNDQTAKHDEGKLQLSLVPTQIIRDIAAVREYGNKKYIDPENWRGVDLRRYIDAFYRHWLAFIDNSRAVDAESGLYAYQHCACNMAFICHMMAEVIKHDTDDDTDNSRHSV